ncbi:MAG TPA: response regulator [Sandaracinaceae bacterium LLY-WYZ-13_1]|nr:response regulator [Sandaracinaceae bacterium LLY-WYZ-13_1]
MNRRRAVSEPDTVLVLDDSEVCLELAREALERAGLRVVTSSSPLGASRLLRQSRPSCVVVDVSMPALDGDKLVEILRRASDRPLPILLHSDRSPDELRARAERCGADGVVHKEPDCRSLPGAVADAIRRATPR